MTRLVLVAHPTTKHLVSWLLTGIPDAVVAHVTDGAPRDDQYAQSKGFENREAYARARRREVVSALGHAGITPERCRGLGYVDGEASKQLIELVFDVVDLLDEVRPDVVFHPPLRGWSLGSRRHQGVRRAPRSGILRRDNAPTPLVLELTSYHNFSGARRVFDFLSLSRSGLAHHPS